MGAIAAPPPARAIDWIPPRPVTALLPSAVFAPSSSHTLTLAIRANGAGRWLSWAATPAGPFTLGVTPSGGSVTVAADGIATVDLTVSLPDTATGVASIVVTLSDFIGGGRVARAEAAIQAATGGCPEILPVPSVWSAPAGTSGSVPFQIHGTASGSESVVLTTGRYDPDPNNAGGLFSGSAASSPVTLPSGGTITVNVPTTIPARAYGGNANAVQLSVTSNGGVATAIGFALASASLADSLPTALVPVGLTPFGSAAAGRDGPAVLAWRGYRLTPCGLEGVRVTRVASTDSIGITDVDGNGSDDRLLGRILIPSFAAALSVVPGFVTAQGETLDVGLLAAGRAGLMLLDLRVLEDFPWGAWSDFFDVDGNGIDDRILRTIPTPGFATDAAWFRASSGRVVALVADADTGSVPVGVDFNAGATVAGTGAGVVAIDLSAAIDSLGGVPYAAGTLATPGSALDLETRGGGGSAADLAIADGSGGVALYGLSTSGGAPATVTFAPRGTAALSAAWGTPVARDLAWIANTGDSAYVAVAAGAGGLQIVRMPKGGGAPALVLAQQTSAPVIGVASTWTGAVAAAMGSGGVALFAAPSAMELGKIGPGAPPPYTQPVTLARGQPWGADPALEVALHRSGATSATSLRFEDATGSAMPDVVASDGPRILALRVGTATVTGVAAAEPSPLRGALRLRVGPNPAPGAAWIEAAWGGSTPAAPPAALGSAAAGASSVRVTIAIYDVRGRLVRRLAPPAGASPVRVLWDGLDGRGVPVASGRYWARAEGPGLGRASAPLAILR
ncbi:MAG: hypothetical protein ACM3JJ_13265 [Hyphomicrobiales bacterium]